MAAPKGNQFNKKLTTPELRKLAYDDYCRWISEGKTYKAWSYESPELTLSYKCMETYIKDHPDDFPPKQRQIAISKGLEVWEEKGIRMMESGEKCQPAIYQMFMRNKFGWDKDTPEEKEEKAKQEQSVLKDLLNSVRNS